MATPSFSGACSFCGETFTTRTIRRHLTNCGKRQAADAELARSTAAKSVPLYQLKVESRGIFGKYWMYIELPADATLRNLDQFLRDIWLECCGHLSAFEIAGERYSVSPMNEAFFGVRERGLSAKLQDILQPDLKFDYEYDFGTTSELKLTVVAERNGPRVDRAVQVLARNTAPEMQCELCRQALATELCVECLYEHEGDPALLCETCAAGHEHDDALLPLVNSPRTGLCGYTG